MKGTLLFFKKRRKKKIVVLQFLKFKKSQSLLEQGKSCDQMATLLFIMEKCQIRNIPNPALTCPDGANGLIPTSRLMRFLFTRTRPLFCSSFVVPKIYNSLSHDSIMALALGPNSAL